MSIIISFFFMAALRASIWAATLELAPSLGFGVPPVAGAVRIYGQTGGEAP